MPNYQKDNNVLIHLIKEDLIRCLPPYMYGCSIGSKSLLIRFVYEYFKFESFHYLFWFRVGSHILRRKGLINKVLLRFIKMKHRHNCHRLGIQIELGTKIGPGFHFGHYSNIVITCKAKIGSNCTIHQGVTIGRTFNDGSGAPNIGNNVIIFPNSILIGGVSVGDNAIISAGSIVIKDVESKTVVGGNPAKPLNIDATSCISDENKWFFGL